MVAEEVVAKELVAEEEVVLDDLVVDLVLRLNSHAFQNFESVRLGRLQNFESLRRPMLRDDLVSALFFLCHYPCLWLQQLFATLRPPSRPAS